jgi:hypothetical protein
MSLAPLARGYSWAYRARVRRISHILGNRENPTIAAQIMNDVK